MDTLRVLVVCTGNTCRSPIAAALLAARLDEVPLAASVRSAGTLGWAERPAARHAVTVIAERGLDISGHVSSRLPSGPMHTDLVVAMTRDHAGAVVARDASLGGRVFLPAEFARLASIVGVRGENEPVTDYVARVGSARSPGPIGRAAEEVPDPAGEPLDTYRRVADRLERDLAALAIGLTAPRIRP